MGQRRLHDLPLVVRHSSAPSPANWPQSVWRSRPGLSPGIGAGCFSTGPHGGPIHTLATPAIHTDRAAHPLVPQRLAARPLGRPWHTSGSGRGGSDPPRRGLGTGSGRGGNSHLAPALRGSLPHHQSLAGRPSERRCGTRRINRSSTGCRRCPKGSHRLPCPRASAESLAPATSGDLGPDTAIRVCHYAAPSVWVSPLVRGDRRRFEAGADPLADRPSVGTVGARADSDTVAEVHPPRKSGCPRRERPLAFLQRTA